MAARWRSRRGVPAIRSRSRARGRPRAAGTGRAAARPGALSAAPRHQRHGGEPQHQAAEQRDARRIHHARKRAAVPNLPLPCLGHVHEPPRVGHLVSCDGHGKAQLPLRQRRARCIRERDEPVRAGGQLGWRHGHLAQLRGVEREPLVRRRTRQRAGLVFRERHPGGGLGQRVTHPGRAAASLHHHGPLFRACGDVALEPCRAHAPARRRADRFRAAAGTSRGPPWSSRTRASHPAWRSRSGRIRHGGSSRHAAAAQRVGRARDCRHPRYVQGLHILRLARGQRRRCEDARNARADQHASQTR